MTTDRDRGTRSLVGEFLGAVHAWPEHLDAMREIGLGWTRLDVEWSCTQPSADAPPDLGNALHQGDLAAKFAQLAAAEVDLLPILDYGTEWAAVSPPHIFHSRGMRYEIRTDPEDPSALVQLVFDPDSGAELAREPFDRLNELPPADSAEWVTYCEYVVTTLAALPYNLRYFQIWNEPTPEAGFYFGSPEDFVDRILIPAAEIVHAHGGKVVFGGWPCSNSLAEMNAMLRYRDAWRHVDILDVHYMPPAVFEWLYDEWVGPGHCEGIWQTEVSSGITHWLVPNEYPRVLHWALDHGLDEQHRHRYKLFFYCMPEDDRAPAGIGPDGSGLACQDEEGQWQVARHGRIVKTFHDLLAGPDLQTYPIPANNLDLVPTLDTDQGSIEAFAVDNRIVVAVHFNQTSASLYVDHQARDIWHLNHPYPRRQRHLTLVFSDLDIAAIDRVEHVSVRGHRIAQQVEPNPTGPGVVVQVDPTDQSEHVRAFAEVRALTKNLYVVITLNCRANP
jgi:hypothetical protein